MRAVAPGPFGWLASRASSWLSITEPDGCHSESSINRAVVTQAEGWRVSRWSELGGDFHQEGK